MPAQHVRQHPVLHASPISPAARADSAQRHARLAARLTARDTWITRMVREHRVLTTPHLTALAFPSQRSAEQRLRELHQWSVVSRFRPLAAIGSAPHHYVLGPAGAALLAAEHGLEVKDLGYRHDRELGRAYSLTLAHTLGINTWFTALIAHARRTRDASVTVWWSEPRCAQHFGDIVRPDAYGRWATQEREMEFFLEYDLGTEALTIVAGKLTGYATLAQDTGIITPLLIWLPTTRREAAARRVLTATWQTLDDPHTVPLATAAADLLDPDTIPSSPADPVWLPLDITAPDMRGNKRATRCSLHTLPDVWPDLEPPALLPQTEAAAAIGRGKALLPPVPPMPPSAHHQPFTHTTHS